MDTEHHLLLSNKKIDGAEVEDEVLQQRTDRNNIEIERHEEL